MLWTTHDFVLLLLLLLPLVRQNSQQLSIHIKQQEGTVRLLSCYPSSYMSSFSSRRTRASCLALRPAWFAREASAKSVTGRDQKLHKSSYANLDPVEDGVLLA